MDKRPQLLAKSKTDLMPNNASCKRWDTPILFARDPAPASRTRRSCGGDHDPDPRHTSIRKRCAMYRRLCVLLLTLGLLPTLSQAEPRIFTFDLGFDEVLGLTSIQDRNDLGDMTIASVAGPRSLLLSRTGEDTPIVCPGSTFTAAKSLNRSRRVVGFCNNAAGVIRGFLRFPSGVMAVIHKPGAIQTQALGLNDGDVVVGDFRDVAGRFHGFRWVSGVFTTFDAPFPGAVDTSLTAINNLWHMVGFSRTATGESQGFLRRNGVYTPLDVPGAVETIPLDLNNADHVVVVYLLPDGTVGSALFDGTDWRRIALPGAEVVMTDVASITNTDVLSGRFLVSSGIPDDFASRGFVLSGLPLETITPLPALRLSRTADTEPIQRPWCGVLGAAKLHGVTSVCPD